MKPSWKEENDFNPFICLRFGKTSPEAIRTLLSALNAEMKEASAAERLPSLEEVFRRIAPFHRMMI